MQESGVSFRHEIVICFLVTLLCARPALGGQTAGTATGSIVGRAADATKAVLAGVEVVAAGPVLMQPRRTTTNAAGEYRIDALTPGEYSLSFSFPGFAPLEHAVRIGLNFTATVDVTLAVERQREEIAVSGRSSVLDRHSAAVADTFDARDLADLPNSRSVPGLLPAAHALYVANIEVGGSSGLFTGTQSAYGRNTSPRHTLEGIVITGLFGFGFTVDYGSLEEASVLTAAHGAEWPTVAFVSTALIAASALEARASCMAAGASNPTTLKIAGKSPRPGTPPAFAQNGSSTGGGPIVGQWQVVMTAFPGTQSEFVFDFGFQQFHADGTELMISGGVPPAIGNVCIGAWERDAGGVIRLRHMTWNWSGNEVLGDLPTGYYWLEVTVRTNSQGTAYAGTWTAASYDLGSGPLGSGGPPQPNSAFEGTLQAVKISAR